MMPVQYIPPSLEAVLDISDEDVATERELSETEPESNTIDVGSRIMESPASALVCDDSNVTPADNRHMSADTFSSRPRSDTARRTATPPVTVALSPGRTSITHMQHPETESHKIATETGADAREDMPDRPSSPSAMSTLTSLTVSTTRTNGSGSSSGSGSTITQASYTRRKSGEKEREKAPTKARLRSKSPKTHKQPDALSFLEPDSPAVTQEAIQRSVEESSHWRLQGESSRTSPSARSTSSSASSSFHSDVFSEPAGDPETDRSSSPEQSVDGDSPKATVPTRLEAQLAAAHQRQKAHRKYGTPEMPRGNANLPHLPPNALQPRLPQTYHGHIKHLPRAEKLPLTGYELLASKLSTNGRAIKPIYRRFETLNHRLLLHLQDELAELEEQLHRLDTADTQNRRLPQSILPASRRQEFLTGGELQWHKTDILGKIGFKLGQYNHVLASFKEAQALSSPTLSDVRDYREYLANHGPIAEIETRFLDPTDDLVTLARPDSSPSDGVHDFMSEDLLTPMPRNAADAGFMPSSSTSDAGSSRSTRLNPQSAELPANVALCNLAVAFAAAFLLPVLAFAVIPGFVGRMAVVLLVGLCVASALIQGGILRIGGEGQAGAGSREWLLCAGVYGGVMTIVAGMV